VVRYPAPGAGPRESFQDFVALEAAAEGGRGRVAAEGLQDLDRLGRLVGGSNENMGKRSGPACQCVVAGYQEPAFPLAAPQHLGIGGPPGVRGVEAEKPKVSSHVAEHRVHQDGWAPRAGAAGLG